MTDIEQSPTEAISAEWLADLEFSDVRGFRLRDFNFSCPTTGRPCPEKMSLISDYTRDIDREAVESGEAARVVQILGIKLAEYSLRGTRVTCSDADNCTIRKVMNESKPRQTFVHTYRGIRGWLRSKNLTEER